MADDYDYSVLLQFCTAPTFRSIFMEKIDPIHKLRLLLERILKYGEYHLYPTKVQEHVISIAGKYDHLPYYEKSKFLDAMEDTISDLLVAIKSKLVAQKKINELQSKIYKLHLKSIQKIERDFLIYKVLPMISISIILSIFVFFGYKLYKSLVEKDRKREQKIKAKQSKKKKN